MLLYMVRHGQSLTNRQGRFTGWVDPPLTESGLQDAQRAGNILRMVSFDRIWCSDLLRARQTLAGALPGAEATLTPLLREVDVGTLGWKRIAICPALFGPEFRHNRDNYNFRPYGGENRADHIERVRRFLALAEEAGGETVLAVCHSGTVRCMLDIVMGEPVDRSKFACENGSVAIFEWKDGKGKVKGWNLKG